MNSEEKNYIDKKFKDMQENFFNQDPKEVIARAKKYQSFYYKYYAKWIALALVLTLGTMIITFKLVGLF